MNVIKEEYMKEYEKRVSIIKNVISNAYGDYYCIVAIEQYLKKYKLQGNSVDYEMCLPAKKFMNTIIRSIEEEFILIVCSLENKDKTANSITQLKAKLHDYLIDLDSYKDNLPKMPPEDDNIKAVRNTAIAHINLDIKCKGTYIDDVKNRLNILKNCFNSYLFDDMVKYKINDNLLKKIETESQIGVAQFFSGLVNMICNR